MAPRSAPTRLSQPTVEVVLYTAFSWPRYFHQNARTKANTCIQLPREQSITAVLCVHSMNYCNILVCFYLKSEFHNKKIRVWEQSTWVPNCVTRYLLCTMAITRAWTPVIFSIPISPGHARALRDFIILFSIANWLEQGVSGQSRVTRWWILSDSSILCSHFRLLPLNVQTITTVCAVIWVFRCRVRHCMVWSIDILGRVGW